MASWNRSDVIALSSLIVAIIAIIASIFIPELRCIFNLQLCPTPLPNNLKEEPEFAPETPRKVPDFVYLPHTD